MKKHLTHTRRLARISLASILLFISASIPAMAKPIRDRHRMMEKLETIKMWKLMDALNLDSETALKVFPIIKEMDRKKVQLMEKKRTLLHQLKDQIDGKIGTQEKIDSLASKIFDLTEQICALSREEYTKLKAVLTEQQLGRFILFQQRFRRELLRRWLQEKRGIPPREPGIRKGPRPKGPFPQS